MRQPGKKRLGSRSLLFVAWTLSLLSVQGTQEGIVLFNEIFANFKNLDTSTWSIDYFTLDPCNWPPVTCNVQGNVIALILSNKNISGTLSSSIGQLPQLVTLKLNNNLLSGTVPWSQLAILPQLQTLELSVNDFAGNLTNITIGYLANLTYINLASNNFSGTVPSAWDNQQCTNFANNALLYCPPSFGNHTNVTIPEIPPSPSPSSSDSTPIIVGVVAGVVVFLLLAGIWYFCKARSRALNASMADEEDPLASLTLGEFGQLHKFSLVEIEEATNNFDPSLCLGEGGTGKVYKGKLGDGRMVAVKRLREDRKRSGDKDFINELGVISRAVHRNLLKLEGFCIEKGERILVFPFMSNGSVADQIKGAKSKTRPPMTWAVRKKVALGTAEGLAYMHTDCHPKLIHLDVKAANILLTDEFEPVVADFGLTRELDTTTEGGGQATKAVKGTIGHIAPEYFVSGQTSEKTDVFAFGVFLLELIAGKGAYDLPKGHEGGEDAVLREWVISMMQEGKVDAVVDEDILNGEHDLVEVQIYLQVALLCMHNDPSERPTMTECVTMLQGEGLADRWENWRTEQPGHTAYPMPPHGLNGFTASNADFSIGPLDLSGPR